MINPRVRRELLKKNKQVANKRASKNYILIMRLFAGKVNAFIAPLVVMLRVFTV